MYYPKKIPQYFLKTTTETEEPVPLTVREQVLPKKSISPLAAFLLLEFLNIRKDG